MRNSKNRYCYHILVSPGDAPGAITLNVVWMEREFDAYKSSRCMCPSNYNRFRDRAISNRNVTILEHLNNWWTGKQPRIGDYRWTTNRSIPWKSKLCWHQTDGRTDGRTDRRTLCWHRTDGLSDKATLTPARERSRWSAPSGANIYQMGALHRERSRWSICWYIILYIYKVYKVRKSH